MRNVLSALLITVAIGTGAQALWACGQIDGQTMTPAQAAQYTKIVGDAVVSGGAIPTIAEVFGGNVTTGGGLSFGPFGFIWAPPAPLLQSFTATGATSTVETGRSKHDPKADVVVPQIDLVPDIAGDIGPDGSCTPQVM